MNRRILVIGLGRLGESLVRNLFAEKIEIIALDTNADNVDQIKDHCHLAVQGDGSDMDTLIEVGAASVDTAVICMGESFEASVLALTNLLELKVPRIEVRASNARKAKIFKSIGAHNVFYIEQEMGRFLAHKISRPSVLHEMELEYGLKIIEWSPAPWAQEKSLADLNLPATHQVKVVALRDPTNPRHVIFPDSKTILRKGLLTLLMGNEKDLQRLLARQ